ncbi:MAG: hypothetical protein COV48_00620 [Elusimicrobia bacterium CG11_big_fil_rev_8_21_14_0_20_64_6]|nr:MAG: hypothetical protein COV48_00620 [Elusimicrobia bacterium CG11_big_fil_rev_8_21_14_0_20_64_6]
MGILFLGLAATAGAADFQNVVVKPGDTLWSISNKYLKDPAKWDEIVKYNKSVSADPTVALPGMTLRVPTRLIKEDLRAAHLVSRVNSVMFRRKATAAWKSGRDNMELFRNDWIRTLADSSAAVRFLDEDFLRLGANSMAVIKPVDKDYAVELKRGGSFYGKAKILASDAVVTPQSRDTRYVATVRDDLSTKVEVLTGEALVAAAGRSVSVKKGMFSEVMRGLTPSVPAEIADMPAFEARAAELRDGVSSPPVPSKRAAPIATGDANDPKAVLLELKLGSAVSGYRIQCSENPDISNMVVSKTVDWDNSVSAASLGIRPGSYWCRVAPIDLLGTVGRYASPRQYLLK